MNLCFERDNKVEELTAEGMKVFAKVGSKIYRTPDGYTSDIVVFAKSFEQDYKVLLIQRREIDSEGNPNVEGGKWAIPGGFVNPDETSLQAGIRELEEETGIKGIQLNHFGVYDTPGRDPRGWIISSAHYAIVNEQDLIDRKAGDDAKQVRLINIREALEMKLAFDHKKIIIDAIKVSKVE